MNASCKIYEGVMKPCKTYEYVLQNIWMRHAKYMNESGSLIKYMDTSCRKYEWVRPNIWRSHAKCMNESCRIKEWVMLRKEPYINEPFHAKNLTEPWVMPNIWGSYAKYMNESCRIYEWVMLRKGPYMNASHHAKTHSYRTEYTNESCYVRTLIWMSHVMQRLIHIGQNTRTSHVTYSLVTQSTRMSHEWVMLQSLIHERDKLHIIILPSHAEYTNESCHRALYTNETCYIIPDHAEYTNESCDRALYEWVMSYRNLTKQDSFQKMTSGIKTLFFPLGSLSLRSRMASYVDMCVCVFVCVFMTLSEKRHRDWTHFLA